jgi:hypothetical protein
MGEITWRSGFSSGFQQTLVLISQISGTPAFWRQCSPRMGYLGKVSKAWALQAQAPATAAALPKEDGSLKRGRAALRPGKMEN